MREINNRLDAALEQSVARFIEQQREQDGDNNAGGHLHSCDEEGVAEDAKRPGQLQHILKVFPSNPRGPKHPLGRNQSLERHDDASHRHVAVDEDQEKARQNHQVKGQLSDGLTFHWLFASFFPEWCPLLGSLPIVHFSGNRIAAKIIPLGNELVEFVN